MKALLVVALLISLSGCSSLILREDDSAMATTGKVAARVILCPLTVVCLSEIEIAARKEKEDRAIQEARYQRWYDSLSPERQAREDAKEAARTNAAGLAVLGFMQSGGLRMYTPPSTPAPAYQAPTFTPLPSPQRCTYSRVGEQIYQNCY